MKKSAAVKNNTKQDAYARLEERFQTYNALAGAMSVLHWDAAVIMPESAASVRGEQLAAIRQSMQQVMDHPDTGALLADAKSHLSNLDHWQQANLREMQRIWQHETSIPARLVRELAVASSESEAYWRTARKNNDFKSFVPYLKRVLALVREEAAIKGEVLKLAPYDALMDGYDPGTRMAEVDEVFARLKAFLPTFRAEVITFQSQKTFCREVTAHYPAERQKLLSEQLMRALGFTGRLDVSAHPFCGGVPGDVRITTRFSETDFMDALQGVLHETGHALYEQNLPIRWCGQPVGHARGMAAHESQSLLVEMQLCRSREFLRFVEPRIRLTLGDAEGINAENLYRLGTRVRPGLIRVRADEVTYPSHVIMRYELEKAMIAGTLAVEDLPEAWNEGMRGALGIVPDSDTDGCLQDIHWPGGSFGYFPTYTLGAIMAAQWFAAMKKEMPDMMTQIARGNFADLAAWLKTHVHEAASLYSRQELLTKVTGEPLNTDVYIRHLQERYLQP